MDEDDDDPVPLPNVNGAIMRKVSVLWRREWWERRGGERGEKERKETTLQIVLTLLKTSAMFGINSLSCSFSILFLKRNFLYIHVGNRVGHSPQG